MLRWKTTHRDPVYKSEKQQLSKTLVPRRPQTAQRTKRGASQSHTVATVRLGISSLPMFVPENYTAKHKYVDNLLLTSGEVGVMGAAYAYALNGMYDPYLGVGGHQPYGFDELSPWFQSYTVTECQVTITYAASNDAANLLGVSWRPGAGSFNPASLGISDFCEKDNSRWMILNQSPARSGDTTVSFQPFSIAKIEGRTREQILTEGSYTGTPAGNPALVPQLYFTMANLAGASSKTVALVVELEYTAIWRGRKTFGQS